MRPCLPSLVQAGIPLLVLGNKNDLPEALSANELIERLGLRVVSKGKACAGVACQRRTPLGGARPPDLSAATAVDAALLLPLLRLLWLPAAARCCLCCYYCQSHGPPPPPPPPQVSDRETCVYSISCKRQANIDVTLRWLQAHAR